MVDYDTYGLLGEKISKSLSPQIYNALFQELKIPAVYMPFPVPKDKFLTALPVLRSSFSGFNVAAPYRLDVMAHLDRLDTSAKRAGTANTVKVENQKLIGYNTDMVGFERSLIGFMGNMYDRDVLLIGAGGAAHAIGNVLLEKGAFLTIVSRNVSNAVALQDYLQKRYNKNRIKVIKGLSHSDEFYAVINSAAVDIESKQSEVSIHSHTYQKLKYAYDISYRQTIFLKKAEDFGVKTKNGFDMLFYQSLGALDVWFGKKNGMDVSIISKMHDQINNSISL